MLLFLLFTSSLQLHSLDLEQLKIVSLLFPSLALHTWKVWVNTEHRWEKEPQIQSHRGSFLQIYYHMQPHQTHISLQRKQEGVRDGVRQAAAASSVITLCKFKKTQPQN